MKNRHEILERGQNLQQIGILFSDYKVGIGELVKKRLFKNWSRQLKG